MTTGMKSNRFLEYLPFIQLITAADIEEVFNYWVSTFSSKSSKGTRAKLTEERKAHIAWAIHMFGVSDCKHAIDGCNNSEWHMGGNPGEKIYNQITLIFRDIEKISRFIRIGKNL